MAFSLMPKEDVFFDLFDQQTDLVCETASTFLDLVKNWNSESPKLTKLSDLEHEADIGTHELFSKLNRTFVTPIDREDIHELTNELDDIIDLIQSISSRMSLYKIHAIPQELIDLVEVLEESARAVKKAVSSLRDMKRSSRILDYCIEINRLENSGDHLLAIALGRLFQNNPEPMEVIKFKEIYEVTERAIDKCEDVAKTLETIVVKHS